MPECAAPAWRAFTLAVGGWPLALALWNNTLGVGGCKCVECCGVKNRKKWRVWRKEGECES